MYHSIQSVDFHLRYNNEVVLSREEWAGIRKKLKGDSKNSAEKTQPSGETNNRSDVICEWKFDDDSGCFDTNCGHNIQDEETTSTWVCCPHCSRKIRTCG
ncbi:MAG TPA: hypothetical protein VMX17_04155 [Candidatus Glassbacteria bacterium]|nr:hypothetical protein [Candidatus Glassbacteria bacterium]